MGWGRNQYLSYHLNRKRGGKHSTYCSLSGLKNVWVIFHWDWRKHFKVGKTGQSGVKIKQDSFTCFHSLQRLKYLAPLKSAGRALYSHWWSAAASPTSGPWFFHAAIWQSQLSASFQPCLYHVNSEIGLLSQSLLKSCCNRIYFSYCYVLLSYEQQNFPKTTKGKCTKKSFCALFSLCSVAVELQIQRSLTTSSEIIGGLYWSLAPSASSGGQLFWRKPVSLWNT